MYKTAEPDQTLAARVVLRDWNSGKFPRYTLPPSPPPAVNTTDTTLTEIYAMDDSVLSQLKTRSEFRKSSGLVKMNPGEINKRTLILDAEWASPEDSEPSEDDDEDEKMIDFYGNDGDDEDDEDSEDGSEDEEDEEEREDDEEYESEPLVPLPLKRKHPVESSKGPGVPPKKRVAFNMQKSVKGGRLPSKY